MSWRTILWSCLGICVLATGGRAQSVPDVDSFVFFWLGRAQTNNWTAPANWLKLSPGTPSLVTTGPLYPSSSERANALFLGTRGKEVLLDASQTLDRMMVGSFSHRDTFRSDFVFKGTGATTLTLKQSLGFFYAGGMDRFGITEDVAVQAGAIGETFQSGRAVFDSTLKVALGGSQEWQISSGLLDFFSPLADAAGTTGNRLTLAGSGQINLYGNNTYGAGTGGGTDLTGDLIVGVGASNAFGSGTITFQPGSYATLTTINGAASVPNAIAIKSSQVYLFSQTGPLTLAGPITLHDTAGAVVSLYAQGKGSSPVYVGNIGESLSALTGMRLAIGGEGTVVLQGTNTYTGGTRADDGSLVVRATTALPAAGDLRAALDAGYIGLATPPTNPADLQTAFVNRFNRSETIGTIGFDTLPAQPVNQFAGAINLADPDGTGPLAAFNSQARLGSASTAILSGTITPQGTAYRFGGGGGKLDVTSLLVDQTGPITTPRALEVQSPAEKPLTLRLNPASGVNSYTGGTSVTQSALIFGSTSALPASGNFTLGPGGYVGLQLAGDVVDATATASGLPAFLARFPTLLSQGYVGFDSSDRNSSRVVSGLNLADFNGEGTGSAGFSSPAIRLATTTNLSLTGNLTLPNTTTLVFLAGYKGGILNVSSTLADGTLARRVIVGDFDAPATGGDFNANLASGVSLFGANTYTGGTTLNAGTLGVGHNNALGSGPLTIAPVGSANYFFGARLNAANPNVTLANNIVLNSDLSIDGANALTLTGNITNGEFGSWGLIKNGNFTLTLSGNNTFGDDYQPSVTIQQGGVNFTNNTAAGRGSLGLVGSFTPVANFSSSAPVIHGLFGDAALGLINLTANSTLTIQQEYNTVFRGGITGTGAQLQKHWSGQLRLEGASTYSGGTWIKEGSIVAANNTALGTGPIRLGQESDGYPLLANLVIESGTTLANAFATSEGIFNYGYLMGSGTLSPPSAPVFGGNNQITLSPGTDGVAGIIGQLGFGSAGVVFGPNGAYEIDIRNAKGLPGLGWDTLSIAGGLQITATPASPFNLRFTFRTLLGQETSDMPYGFNAMAAYNWRIASTGAGITGYHPTKFTLSEAGYSEGALSAAFSSYYDHDLNFGEFLTSVSNDNKNLFLSFSPARYWTGATGKSLTSETNWRGKLAPLSDASAGLLNIVYLGSNRFGSLALDSAVNLYALKFGTVGSPSRYSFDGTTGAGLAIGSGGIVTSYGGYETYSTEDYYGGLRATFAPNIGITLAAPQTWQLGYDSRLVFKGVISGPNTSRLTLAGDGWVSLLGANTYLGNTDINGWMRIVLGGSSPFGGAGGTPGRVTVNNGVTFATTNGAATIPNPLDLKSYELFFDGYHGGLSLTGPVTLFQSTSLRPNGPGALTIAGNITESGGAATLTVGSTGTVVLQGTNTYTGGTFASSGGRIIFGTPGAIPPSGSLAATNSGYLLGYIGLGFVPAGHNVQTAFLDRFNKPGTFGYLGFDTPDTAQSVPNTFSGPVSLVGFNADVRLGSASRAILAGAITPQGANYLFGGGGGTLEVSSPLTGERALNVVSPAAQPLTLRLSNANSTTPNTFLGGVQTAQSAVVFAGSAALPPSGEFTPFAGGYIGQQLAASTAPGDAAIAAFVNRFPANHPSGYFGFDSASGSGVTVSGLDLTRLSASATSGIGLATTTNLTLAGNLTLASGATSYRLAGYKGGILTVATSLTDLDASHPRSVVIGDSAVPATAGTQSATGFLDSVVKLTGANTYTGGTLLNQGRLVIGGAGALGSGGVTVANPAEDNPYRTIEFGAAVTLANTFQFNGPVVFDGAFDATLNGAISSTGWEWIKRGSSTLTLGGLTAGFQNSRIVVQGGTLKFTSPLGNYNSLAFEGAGGAIDFASGSSPVWSLNSEPGIPATVNLATSSTELAVFEYGWSNYAGNITGSGRLVKEHSGLLSLGGNSTYTGGTQIRSGTIVATTNTALGASTGPVTLGHFDGEGHTYGTVATGPGVTLANPLTLTAGSLAGFGTFAPAARPVIGSRALLAPGGPDDAVNRIGTLGFGASGLEFAGGGEYRLDIQDPFGSPGNGYDTLAIAGGLHLSATSSSVFTLRLLSLTPYGTEGGLLHFNPATQSFSLTVATFSSLSGGFDPGKFALNLDSFSPGPVPDTFGHFYLSATPTTLLLNFTPVPEPSTYALLLAGLGALGLASRRRRRR